MSSNNVLELVRLYVPYCEHTYGQAPCTASGPAGTECYNSFATCQDKANFSPEVHTGSDIVSPRCYRLISQAMSGRVDGGSNDSLFNGSPVVVSVKHTSELIKRGEGVAVRGGVDIICTDSAQAEPPINATVNQLSPDDKYAGNRNSVGSNNATLFGTLKARYPYYNGYPIDVRFQRFDSGGILKTSRARFYLDTIDGPDERGRVTLRCRDILTRIDSDYAQAPEADSAKLAANINPTASTITLTDYNAAIWPTGGGYLVIEEEMISYASRSGATLSGCVRGLGNTDRTSHDAGERAILAKVWDNENVVDVIYDLLVNHAGIPADYIPYTQGVDPNAQWDLERSQYLSGHNVSRVIFEPRGVASLLDEVCQQCHVNLYTDSWDPYQIYISAINSGQASIGAPNLSEEKMIAGSVKTIERRKRMISQSWIYYSSANQLEVGRPADYTELAVLVDTELEDPNAWGQKRVAAMLGSWLYQAGNVALITNSRIMNERSIPQYEVTFEVDWDEYSNGIGSAPNDGLLKLAGFINMNLDSLQAPDGSAIAFTWQIIKAEWSVPMMRVRLTAATVRPRVLEDFRFGNIVDVANEGNDYFEASQAARDAWAWVGEPAGFSNGDEPYIMS